MTKFDVRLNKKGIQQLPNNKSGVYIIKNHNGTALYAGIVTRGKIPEQLAEHFYRGEKYIPGAWVRFEQLQNLDQANARLDKLLNNITPTYQDIIDNN